jgi:hypothetical protein
VAHSDIEQAGQGNKYFTLIELNVLKNHPDEVHLSKHCERWPVELAEQLLASSLPWGPPAYAPGIGYTDDPQQPDQSGTFLMLAHCIDGAYERHGGSMGEAWDWAHPLIESLKAGGSCSEYSTQDLLDLVFLYARGERFSDGLIRSAESILREMVREVVQRIHSSNPPTFLR